MLKWAPHQPENLCMKAITIRIGLYFSFIKSPSAAACWYALHREPKMAISALQNPPEDMCLYAVGYEGSLLQFILVKSQTQKVCSLAVERDPSVIKYVAEVYKDKCNAIVERKQTKERVSENYKEVRPTNLLGHGRGIGRPNVGFQLDWRSMLKDWDATHSSSPKESPLAIEIS